MLKRSLLLAMTVACVGGLAALRAIPGHGLGRPGATCTARVTKTAWVSFLGAFTIGNYRRLDELFADEPDFGWFSSNTPGLRTTTAARDRRTLINYFRKRHAQRDRLRLISFQWHGKGNFTYTLWRSANDYKAGAAFHLIGKGFADCSEGLPRFVIVSLGGPGPIEASPIGCRPGERAYAGTDTRS
jgi:hypothetical protein